MRLFWHADSTGGQGYYRSVAPIKFLRKNLPKLEIDTAEAMDSLDYDAFLFHRACTPPTYLKKQGKMILWELDDDLWHIPEWSPAHGFYNKEEAISSMNWFLENSDVIIVSTQVLADEVKPRTSRPVVVLPNLIDLDIWQQPLPWSNNPLKIMWAGSPYHEFDIEGIVPALDQILRDYPNISVYFAGDLPLSMADFKRIRWQMLGEMIPHRRYEGRVVYIPFTMIPHFPSTLMKIRPDISLAPIFPCKFNNAKAPNKYWEGSLAGAATVASNLSPYQGGYSVLVDRQTQWYENIKFLIDNSQRRLELADKSLNHVVRNHSWQSPAIQPWLDFFGKLSS
jgi:hypothetical protein